MLDSLAFVQRYAWFALPGIERRPEHRALCPRPPSDRRSPTPEPDQPASQRLVGEASLRLESTGGPFQGGGKHR